MKKLFTAVLVLVSLTTFANDQEEANGIYQEVSEAITEALSYKGGAFDHYLMDSVLNAEKGKRNNYCQTGYWDIFSNVSVGVPFGIGRKRSCRKFTMELAIELEDLKDSDIYKYFTKTINTGKKARQALAKLNRLQLPSSCHDTLKSILQEYGNGDYFWKYTVAHNTYQSIEMNTFSAVDFLESNKDLVAMLEYANTNEEYITHGARMITAIKLLTFAVRNGLVVAPTVSAELYARGCEI